MALDAAEGWDRFNRFVPEKPTGEQDADWMRVPRELGAELLGASAPAEPRDGGLGIVAELAGVVANPVRTAHALVNFGLGLRAGDEGPSFRVLSHAGSRSGRTLTLQQQTEGHDIVGARVRVHFGRSGDFVVTGRALADLRLRTPRASIRTTPAEAAKSATAALELPAESVRSTDLQCFPMPGGEARWVWRVGLLSEEPVADVRAYLDAETLQLTLSYNIASALSGRATIFPRNPTTPAVEVALGDLGPKPTDQLSGSRLVVVPSELPPLVQPQRDFRIDQAELAFDEPNAYYHLRRGLRYFTALKGRRRRFASPPFRPLATVVRHRPSRNNAFYVPETGKLLFGSFDVGSSALSADILYHELGHAISDNASRLSRGLPGSESRGLSEGYSDYFAESALDNPLMCDWVAPTQARNAADPTLRFAPAFLGPEHDTGSVWAAVLWGLRSQVGPSDADQIAYDSLYLVGPDSTFSDARQALQTVNKELFAGGKLGQDCAAVIDDEWAKRT